MFFHFFVPLPRLITLPTTGGLHLFSSHSLKPSVDISSSRKPSLIPAPPPPVINAPFLCLHSTLCITSKGLTYCRGFVFVVVIVYFGSSINPLVSLGDGIFSVFTPALTHLAHDNYLKILDPCTNELEFACTYDIDNLLYLCKLAYLNASPSSLGNQILSPS